jgi:two-component system, chemotaxis family, sensor kinase CheA
MKERDEDVHTPVSIQPEPSIHGVLMMPELVERFCAESEEQLSCIELILLAWEQGDATAEMISEAFRAMHSLKGNCGIMGLGDMEKITHNLEGTFAEWKSGKSAPHQSQITAILGVLDVLRRTLNLLPAGGGRIPERKELIATLNFTASQAPPDSNLESEEWPAPESMATDSVVREREDAAESTEEKAKKRDGKASAQERASSSIRVDTRKLDELMNLVGELIIAETTVTHNPDLEGHDFENFQKAALNLNRITRQLQDVAMQTRMIPIEATFQKMVRLVRDVSRKQGKKVNFLTIGEETEVDKSVVETIADPLVHLIRNGIDHGLEDSTDRTAAGKTLEGKLQLHAHHQGGEVWISISDDGRGIDPDRVLRSAIQKGVAEAGRTYSREEILQMIFAPGFSTAEHVTDISGRGVGMDVVKRNIEKVNGRIDIDTELGRGTTFTLRIPLTLAIIEGMLVRTGTSYFTIPLLSIRESVKAEREHLTLTSDGQELLKLRGRHYPITKLNELAGTATAADLTEGILVLVESEGHIACILVDEVVGQRQTVIKPLPDYLRNLRSLGGCSILHNGDISLILDIDSIVRSSQKQVAA